MLAFKVFLFMHNIKCGCIQNIIHSIYFLSSTNRYHHFFCNDLWYWCVFFSMVRFFELYWFDIFLIKWLIFSLLSFKSINWSTQQLLGCQSAFFLLLIFFLHWTSIALTHSTEAKIDGSKKLQTVLFSLLPDILCHS